MRQFGHTCALLRPLYFVAIGFAGNSRMRVDVSAASGSFLSRPGLSKLDCFGGNSAPDRVRRCALRVSRIEFRDGLKAAGRFGRSGSRRSDTEPVMARPCPIKDPPLRRSVMFRAGFPIGPPRPDRLARGGTLNGIFVKGNSRAAQSFPLCASLAKRCDIPVPLSFAGIRADEA